MDGDSFVSQSRSDAYAAYDIVYADFVELERLLFAKIIIQERKKTPELYFSSVVIVVFYGSVKARETRKSCKEIFQN